jgi:ADP-ribosylglycohydrolase
MMSGMGPFRLAPGQVTDDGELTMSLAWVRASIAALLVLIGRLHQALSESSSWDLERIASRYSDWVKSKPFDIGMTTRQSLGVQVPPSELISNAMRSAAKATNRESLSNGALMRVVPLGIW